MKRNKIPFILMLLLSVVACDKYLDKDPDSRVTSEASLLLLHQFPYLGMPLGVQALYLSLLI